MNTQFNHRFGKGNRLTKKDLTKINQTYQKMREFFEAKPLSELQDIMEKLEFVNEEGVTKKLTGTYFTACDHVIILQNIKNHKQNEQETA